MGEPAFLLGSVEFLGRQIGEQVHSFQVIPDAVIGEVVDDSGKPADLTLNHEALVDIRTLPESPIPAEEADLSIRIPPRMTDPPSQIEDLAGHRESSRR